MKIRLTPFVAGLGALVALVSCGEPESPSLPVGTVDVVAYVDMDASNSLTSADQRLSGLSVSLYDGTDLVATQTTGSDGHAIFENVLGGSYRVELSGGPAGAALTTNPSPSAVVDAPGDTAEVDFRFVYFPGSVTGRVYRDDDASGTFTAGDEIGSDLWVWIFLDASAIPFDSVETDDAGAWSFDLLPQGSYRIEFENPPSIVYTAGASRQVDVGPREEVTLDATYTGSLAPPGALPRIVITEVMPDPQVISDDNGEYFEIYNAGPVAVDLSGWTFVDASTSATPHTITGLTIQPGQFMVFSKNTNPATNGGITVAQQYAGIFLNNSSDRLVLKNSFGQTVDSVAYGSFTSGSAFGVINPLTDNADMNGSNWQLQTTIYSDPNKGTPGAENDGWTEPPQIVITEVMPDPQVISDNNGEYFEIFNAGARAVTLDGWTFVDASATATPHTITGLTIQPGDYMVFAMNDDPATNGGISVDQEYAGIFLNNGTDRVVLKNSGGVTIDSVAYSSFTSGAAFGVIDPTADNADMNGSNWQFQTTVYSDPNRGTPGARNDGQVFPRPRLRSSAPTAVSGTEDAR